MTASKPSSTPISTSDRNEIEFQRTLDTASPEQVKGFLSELVTLAETREKSESSQDDETKTN